MSLDKTAPDDVDRIATGRWSGLCQARRLQWAVLIGNINGRLDTRQYLQVDRPHIDLLLTLAQLFDPTITEVGDPALNTGPITELLAP